MNAELKSGDRVRVTFEGTFREEDDETLVIVDKGTRAHRFGPRSRRAFEIEKLPHRIEIGDRVTMKGGGGEEGEVVFMKHGEVVVDEGDELQIYETADDLVRVTKDS